MCYPTISTGWMSLWITIIAAFAFSQQARAEEQLRATPSPRAVEAVHLLESDDPYQRQVGFLRLEALREPSTVEIIRPYVGHKDPEIRAYSLRALAAIEGGKAVPLLLQTLKRDKHPRVRRAALLGLEPFQRQDPDILPAFLQALRDRNTEVRMAAVDIVSRINDPKARDALLMRNKRERRHDVRRILALAMKRLGTLDAR